MKNTGIRSIAQNLQAMGRNGDSILAHIMPEEAAMLKRMGGAGTINPKTGLPEFYFGDISSYGGSSPGGSTSGGGRDSSSSNQSPSYGSGGGRDSSSSNQSPTYSSGGGRDSSSSNQSPTYSSGGGGFNSANFGVGGGMLTPSTPSMSSVGGGGFVPTGGNSSDNYMRSLGVPTIIANAAGAVGNVAQNAGQRLLDFSDYTTGQYRQMMADPSGYLGGLLPTPSPQQTPTGPNIDPEATRRSIRLGEAIGGGLASLRDVLSAPAEIVSGPPGFRSEAASGGYDFTPAAPQVPTQLDPGGSGRQVSPSEAELFYEMQRARFEDQYGRPAAPMPEPRATESIQVPQAAPTPQGPPGFRSEAATGAYAITPVSLPGFRSEAALDSLTAPAGPPGFRSEAALEPSTPAAPQDTTSLAGLPPGRLGAFDMPTAIQQYRQGLGGISVPSGVPLMGNVVAGDYVNDPNSSYYESDEQIAEKILTNLPLAGLTLGPGGSIVTQEGGIPSAEQMDRISSLASRPYTVPQERLPQGATGQMTLDPRQFVDIRPAPMPPERQAESPVLSGPPGFRSEAALEPAAPAGPPGFRSEVAQNVAQNLDQEFERVTGNLTEGPASAPPSALGLPSFAQVPPGSPMAFPETAAAAPSYRSQPTAPGGVIDYTTERLTDPRSQPTNLREAISNPSFYFGMSYPALTQMPNPTQAGVAAMLANIRRESSFRPGEYNPGEFGFGFAQWQQKQALPAAGRLNSMLQNLGIDTTKLPAEKNAQAAAIQQALAGTDVQQIGVILNEIATVKAYAPTYRALTEPGISPADAAFTYMKNFEGAKIVPSKEDIRLGKEESERAILNARIAKQGADAERIARTQFSGTQLRPSVSQIVETVGPTSPQATREAIQTRSLGNLLDYSLSASGLRSEVLTEGYNPPPSPRTPITGFREPLRALGYTDQEIDRFEGKADLPPETASAISGNLLEEVDRPRTGGDGGRDYDRPSRPSRDLPPETTPVEPEPVDYTTGFDLTRRTYTPSRSAETFSPAYP